MRAAPVARCTKKSATRVPRSVVLALLLTLAVARADASDTCLLVSADNIVKGAGNWYTYIQISDKAHKFEAGERLEYDIYISALNPELKGGLDIDLKDVPAALREKPWARDAAIQDQSGLRLHGDAILEPAKDKWYHRTFDLAALTGATATHWNVQFEGDAPGRYVQLLDNIRITRDGKTAVSIYDNGRAPDTTQRQTDGYSRKYLVSDAPREATYTRQRIEELLGGARKLLEIREAREKFQNELGVARDLARQLNDAKLLADIDAAAQAEQAVPVSAGNYLETLHNARHRLAHAHPMMQKFTGHLVGHAHIDLQWLWTWDDVVDHVIPDTFGQAIRFMKEFPEFTFSQSSACLYLVTQERHPKLFEDIRKYVNEGRWELIGGRWCEGDTNMISPESHVRHLLYGQRYFQKTFGRICTVGWEPDTFGHTWTLPQILRKGGIDFYYFCRGGKKIPLFWWESPDGSRVLAFDEPATGGWYGGGLDDGSVRELGQFVRTTNAFDHLMVYGVGNHGGGPTRESIEAAMEMQKRGLFPAIKFSTASGFFGHLSKQAARLSAPTVSDELNPVFEGCYTSHSKIKKYNRDSETLLESAEVWAALASLHGRAYPREAFEDMWRDVLWNHHHDTLPGSFIHASALFSARMYDRLLERGGQIRDESQRELISHMRLGGAGQRIVVFNPVAWERSDVVEATMVIPASAGVPAIRDDKGTVLSQLVSRTINGDRAEVRMCFLASGVPGCGYRAYAVDAAAHRPSETINPTAGALFHDSTPCSVQVLTEDPHGMSAWTLGAFSKVEPLKKPISVEVLEDGGVRRRTRTTWRWDKSTIIEECMTYPSHKRVDYATTIDWGQLGNSKDGGPMVKVVFESGVKAVKATFEIPFGDIARPANGHEDVALKWCDLTGKDADGRERGVAVLNDCKHAYDVKDGVIRLTLVRSSYNPDPCPDVGTHHMRYASLPHDGPLDKAAVARAAWEFNKPLQAIVVAPAEGHGSASERTAPTAWSGCEAGPSNVIITGMKRAEDNDDVIIRAYECAGKAARAHITLGFDAKSATECDLLERPWGSGAPVEFAGRTVTTEFKPYEIRTFRVRL